MSALARGVLAGGLALLSTACVIGPPPGGPAAPEALHIELVLPTAETHERVEVRGAALAALAPGPLEFEAGARLFPVAVAEAGVPERPMLGRYEVAQGALAFEPRFRLRPGLEYRATFRPALLPGASGGEPEVSRMLRIAVAEDAPTTVVQRVFPSADALPENLLKLYVHFSAPMGAGEAYARARLVDETGAELEGAFLAVEPELWDPTRTRLTLLLDPGRIKRGLARREALGPILEAGRSYALLVDAAWRDAGGRPLAGGFAKPFRALPADGDQPDPRRWTLALPRAGTREPLVLGLDEALDHALLERVIGVRGPRGERLAGEVEIAESETLWRFVPRTAWAAGDHALEVETILEDLAGNSLGRPFEVTGDTELPPSGPPLWTRPFTLVPP